MRLTASHPTHLLSLTVALMLATLACALPSSAPADPATLFRDDFSSENSGWARLRDENGITDYDQGGYRIQVLQPNLDYWSNPGLNFEDVLLTVEAKKLGGPDENDFGLICRYQDESNFYFFIVGNDGYYGIGKVKDGTHTLIGMQNLQFHAAIRQGDGAVNILRATCVGTQLSLTVNGTPLIEVHDQDFSTGDVGLIAGSFDEAGSDILFDNFVVKRP